LTKRRVVVTGVGIVSPVGLSFERSWENVVKGQSGVAPATTFDVKDFSTRFWAVVKDFDITQFVPPKDARKMDPSTQYAIPASDEAMQDSQLDMSKMDPFRVGVAVGSGIGGLKTIVENTKQLDKGGPRRVSPFFIPAGIINMVAGQISIRHQLKGPNISVVTACTTGTHNIGIAARCIAYGDADVMVAGGTEYAQTKLCLSGFGAVRALSKRNDAPEKASRPFDRDRDGFVLGEGAGIMVLEEYEHAKRRGARIYAELIGFGMSGDAYHITSPDENGDGATQSMVNAIRDAQIDPTELDYINAHGTSTKINDLNETIAIKRSLGEHAYKVAISSTKSMTGHLLGAAGAIEAVFGVLAIRDQVVPPTINLDNPDAQCDLDYVPHTARDLKVNTVLSNSFGFGGTNGTLIFRAV
jgi:3-oxoacyl-[acyl-carrier-protein] synthase II